MTDGPIVLQPTLYEDLIAAGVKVDNHYSDLYCPVSSVSSQLVAKHGNSHSCFVNNIGELW